MSPTHLASANPSPSFSVSETLAANKKITVSSTDQVRTNHRDQSRLPCLTNKHLLLGAITILLAKPATGTCLTRNTVVFFNRFSMISSNNKMGLPRFLFLNGLPCAHIRFYNVLQQI